MLPCFRCLSRFERDAQTARKPETIGGVVYSTVKIFLTYQSTNQISPSMPTPGSIDHVTCLEGSARRLRAVFVYFMAVHILSGTAPTSSTSSTLVQWGYGTYSPGLFRDILGVHLDLVDSVLASAEGALGG